MNERSLLKLAKERLTKKGGIAWSGSSWKDIFGIFDILYIDERGRSAYYQISTKDHRWARMRKIDEFVKKNKILPRPAYLMLWNYKINDWEIEAL